MAILETGPGTVENEIKIFTLGRFQIRQGELVLSDHAKRSKKIWEVFKFLLSHRQKTFTPDALLEKIWPDHSYTDPSLVTRALIFRLRQALKSEEGLICLDNNIAFSHGSYHWMEATTYWLDVDEMQRLVAEAELLIHADFDQAVSLLRKAINLYAGEYLPEEVYCEWIEPLRSHYSGIYVDAVLRMVELLSKINKHHEIIRLCEQAAALCFFEEKIHVKMIEALLVAGEKGRARAHYNEVTSRFYSELGIKPSPKLKNLYRFAGSEEGGFELDLGIIQEGLKEKETINGAFYCDRELFRYFYKMDRLRFERSGQSILLVLLTLTMPNYSMPDKNTIQEVMNNLQEVILRSLRKGDLVTRWSEAQFLLLLPGLNREQAKKVAERIENAYHKKYSLQDLILHSKIESLLPLEKDRHFS